ncbi:hypothetical protein TNCV_2224901 [Trichonephila clavipes]|nr:hypothetical protein TNCV_2224901 [Trichonephila clavipes]
MTLPMYIHKCDYLDAVSRTCIRIWKNDVLPFMRPGSSLIIPLKTFRSAMQHQGKPELRVHAAANIKLFVQVLRTTPVFDSGLVAWLHDPFKPWG